MVDGAQNDLVEFGQKLREIRKSKKLSMEKLANIADMERVQISRIELGKTNPKLSTIYALARALDVDVTELFRPGPEK